MIKPVPLLSGVMVLLAMALCVKSGPALAEETVHVGFSRSIIGEVNENDTMAAVKLWATKLVITDDFPVNVQPKIYEDVKELEMALEQDLVDLISLSTVEFVDLQDLLDRENIICAVNAGSIPDEYLLLVRTNSRFAAMEDLKGGVLRFLKNGRTVLSTLWLDVELAKTGRPATKDFFGQVIPGYKIGEALLPVFFGKADACLVTRKGFETMAELNPQISEQLKILAVSKAYVSSFLGFRKNYQGRLKHIILNNVKDWDQTPAGYQILTMFQMDDLVLKPIDFLKPAMELIKEHRRWFGADTNAFRSEFGTWPELEKHGWATVR
nr:PhnD/SsuA/transferrin family substrate-binding protein [uncultured Desulfobacter sp.]